MFEQKKTVNAVLQYISALCIDAAQKSLNGNPLRLKLALLAHMQVLKEPLSTQ